MYPRTQLADSFSSVRQGSNRAVDRDPFVDKDPQQRNKDRAGRRISDFEFSSFAIHVRSSKLMRTPTKMTRVDKGQKVGVRDGRLCITICRKAASASGRLTIYNVTVFLHSTRVNGRTGSVPRNPVERRAILFDLSDLSNLPAASSSGSTMFLCRTNILITSSVFAESVPP